ncbi:centrosomal protein of 57 kDa-like [Amphiura filiformis]|uniref:centrosomal protein of 57 kDa-like n=1 Tax=Amphiura filiformis TaxID=82378 RepID=UPI003B20F37A
MDTRYLSHSSRPAYPGSTLRSPYSTRMTGTDYGSTSIDADDTSQMPQESTSSYHDYPTRRPLLHDQAAPGKSPRIIKSVPETRSRAIMSALRGLQDRIRSLELERVQAENNLKSLATETTHYRDVLQRQNTVRETTQTEISKQSQEVQSKLSNAESRCALLEKQLEYMRKMVQSAEQDRQAVLHKQELRVTKDREVNEIETQDHMKKLDELEREHVRLKATQTLAESKIRQLEDKVREERHQRKMFQDRAAELHTAAETNRILLDTDGRIPAAEKPKKTKRKKRKTSSAPVKKTSAPVTGTMRSRCRSQSPGRHYRLNLGQIPFVAGTSTSPSHSVGANVQNVIAMMKTHHPAWCGNGPLTRPAPPISRPRRSNSVSSSTGSDSDLSELLLGLQDEFGQMGFEHHELAKQIQETEDTRMRDDLERELDELVVRMEAKGEQIARLKRHKIQVSKKKSHKKSTKSKVPKRPASSRSSESNSTAAEVQVITTVKSKGKKAPPIRVSNNRDGGSRNNFQMLRDMRTLQTSLRKDDVSWD